MNRRTFLRGAAATAGGLLIPAGATAAADAAPAITIVTANLPGRLAPHRDALAWCHRQGADIVLAQEHRDGDNWAPRGWGRYRPSAARSNTIYHRRSTVDRTPRKGFVRLSSTRVLLWRHFRFSGRPIRVASVHLPAFYHQNKASYDRQARAVAQWARGGRHRVVGGDFNGSKGGARMEPIVDAVRLSRPVPSSPQGNPIDYVGGVRGGSWRVVDTVRGPRFDSDHNLVLVRLRWVG